MEHLVRDLVHLGLSEKEAEVYLALLELSPAAIQDIAEKAGVNRSSTYLLVEALQERGIVSTTIEGKKQFYVAEPPERLLAIVRAQKQELEEKERTLLSSIPMLNAVYNAKNAKPRIQYFEGMQWASTVRDLLYEAEGEIIQIVPLDESESVADILKKRPDHFEKLRAENIPVRGLMVMDVPDSARIPDVPNAEMRVVSAREFPIKAEITVRGDTVLLFSYKSNLLSVVITNAEFAETIRALFNMAWRGQKNTSEENSTT